MAEAYDVFFSYSHRDKEGAKQLVERLESAELSCFIAERDVSGGQQWEPRIREALQSSELVLLLLTPRSKSSTWVAAEAGAAWVLDKPLIAAMMYVDPDDLIEPLKMHQGRRVETPEQVDILIREITAHSTPSQHPIDGQWLDPTDGKVAYFRQHGNRVVGYYDSGTGSMKVGLYRGEFSGRVLTYDWSWLSGRVSGSGTMRLSADGTRLSGRSCYSHDPTNVSSVEYRRVSSDMPPWLTESDFESLGAFLADKE